MNNIKVNIYPVAQEIVALQELLESGEADEEQISLELAKTGLDMQNRCVQTVLAIKNVQAIINGMKDAERDLRERRQKIEKSIESAKKQIFEGMETIGITDIQHQSGLCHLKIKENREHLEVDDDFNKLHFAIEKDSFSKIQFLNSEFNREIPGEYIRIKLELDKNKLTEAIKKGEKFDFCRLEKTRKLEIK